MGQGGFTRLLNHFLGAGQFVPDAVLLETVRMEIIAHGFSHILSSFLQKDSWKGNLGMKHQGTSECLRHSTSSTQRSWPWADSTGGTGAVGIFY